MAWLKPSSSVDDLVLQLSANSSPASLTLLRARRNITGDAAVALALALANNTSLVELCIAGHDIGEKGAAAFGDALKTNRSLRALQIGNVDFGDANLALLCRHGHLGGVRRLDLARRSLKDLAPLSHVLVGLEELDLSSNDLRTFGLHSLALGIPSAERLKILRLDCVGATPSAASVLALALRVRSGGKALELLSMAGNPSLGPEGVAALAEAPADAIILDGCLGGDQGAIAIALGQSRRSISLASNGISANAAKQLADALVQGYHGSLISLNLARNDSLGDEGIDALASALPHLWHLDLSLTMATRLPARILSITDTLMFMGNRVEWSGVKLRIAWYTLQTSLRLSRHLLWKRTILVRLW